MQRYNLVMTQMIILFGITDSGNAPLKRVSGTLRARSVAKSDCHHLTTVFKTDHLHESVPQILKKAIRTQCPKECALLCFQAKCNIAHFDSSKKMCHFTQNTAPHLTICNWIWLIERRGNESKMTAGVHSFCVFCGRKKSRPSTTSLLLLR